jgi:hypothetical protein
MANDRLTHLKQFYTLLERLAQGVGGARTLNKCSGRIAWPKRGVYFIMEPGENRSDSGNGPRVVRVGTHALKARSTTTLWTRLSQHRGQMQSGGGNHRGSIFRLITGSSLIRRHIYVYPTWGCGNTARSDIRAAEKPLETEVSILIGRMPLLWLALEDEAGPNSVRGYIERNSIALLSNFAKTPLDAPSAMWLGLSCDRQRIRESGLWNSNHVDEPYDPAFLSVFEQHVADLRLQT